jgi:hypothetical protein
MLVVPVTLQRDMSAISSVSVTIQCCRSIRRPQCRILIQGCATPEGALCGPARIVRLYANDLFSSGVPS